VHNHIFSDPISGIPFAFQKRPTFTSLSPKGFLTSPASASDTRPNGSLNSDLPIAKWLQTRELFEHVPIFYQKNGYKVQGTATEDRTHGGTSESPPDEAVEEGRIREGDYILLEAFGGGLTWASALMKW
jgi:3-Oxoacyl-[acyl-carrier-protein (ACP)] synthase III C terminal